MRRNYEPGMVSVIIPTFNLEKYIEGAVFSVLDQTVENIEIVIVDDHSTDGTDDIVSALVGRYPDRIIYEKLKENSGVAVVRNRALDLAKGQYVAFLDGDDWWYPSKLEKQLQLMHESKVGFTYTAIEIMDEDGDIIKGKRNVVKSIDYKFLLKNTMIATSSVVLDRNFVGEFHMPLRRSGQDYATWLMILRTGIMAYGINKALVKYRKNKSSLSSKKYKNVKKVWDVQIHDEGINVVFASVNSLCYIINAFRKYYM